MVEIGSQGEQLSPNPLVGEVVFGQTIKFPKDWKEYQELRRPFNLMDESFDAAQLITDAAEVFWAEKRLAWEAHELDFYSEETDGPGFDVILMPGVAAWENRWLPQSITRHLPPWVPYGMRDCYDSPIKYMERYGAKVTTVFPPSGFNSGDFDEEERLTVEVIERLDGTSDRRRILLGHSMGAIGQGLLAARHPEIVDKIDGFCQVGGPLPLKVNSIVERYMIAKNQGVALRLAAETVEYLGSSESSKMREKTSAWISEQDHVIVGVTPTAPRVGLSGHSALLHNQRLLDDVIAVAKGY